MLAEVSSGSVPTAARSLASRLARDCCAAPRHAAAASATMSDNDSDFDDLWADFDDDSSSTLLAVSANLLSVTGGVEQPVHLSLIHI